MTVWCWVGIVVALWIGAGIGSCSLMALLHVRLIDEQESLRKIRLLLKPSGSTFVDRVYRVNKFLDEKIHETQSFPIEDTDYNY